MKNNSNNILLNRINNSNSWCHYRKTKAILAKELKASEKVETHEGEISYYAGNYLCKGPSGDIWGQKAESLLKKYEAEADSKPDKEGWQKFLPKADASGVMAASIDHDFTVEHPVWGTFHGKAGSYLVKKYEDKDNKFPEDIWIVIKEIFESTYERV